MLSKARKLFLLLKPSCWKVMPFVRLLGMLHKIPPLDQGCSRLCRLPGTCPTPLTFEQHICMLLSLLNVTVLLFPVTGCAWSSCRCINPSFPPLVCSDHPAKLSDISLTQSVWVNVFGLQDSSTCFTLLKIDELLSTCLFKVIVFWWREISSLHVVNKLLMASFIFFTHI